MILINRREVSTKEIAEIIGYAIPLDLIKKKPLFEINPDLVVKDPANGPAATKHRNSMTFPAVFYAKDKTGNNLEIRYCTSRTPDPKTMGNSEKYAPRELEFDGKAEVVNDDLDKAVYFFLHPFCKTSPFRPASSVYEYELVDDDKKASELITLLQNRAKASGHAAGLSEEQMLIVSKGINLKGASTQEPMMVRALLMQYANDNPLEYLSRVDNQVNMIRGTIIDGVDKEVFRLDNEYNTKRWFWNKGPRKGELITQMPSEVQDSNEALVQHVLETPNALNNLFGTLVSTLQNVNREANVKAVSTDIDVLSMFKQNAAPAPIKVNVNTQQQNPVSNTDSDINASGANKQKPAAPVKPQQEELPLQPATSLPLPSNYNDALVYLKAVTGKQPTKKAKALVDAVTNKEVTYENIDQWLANFGKITA